MSTGYNWGATGGICGYDARGMYGKNEIINCINQGKIGGKVGFAGGIIGWINVENWTYSLKMNIYNSYNLGEVTSENNIVGGILGKVGGYAYDTITIDIENCYNAGNLNSQNRGGIVGQILDVNGGEEIVNVKNSYYLQNENLTEIYSGKMNITQVASKTESELKSIDFVNLLNNYKNANSTYTTNWKDWELGTNGYPALVKDE